MRSNMQPIVIRDGEAILEVNRAEVFKMLAGHENHRVAVSEYLFKTLQPTVEDILFLGTSYERLFDKFEVLRAVCYADLAKRTSGWAPLGRFAWKYHQDGHEDNPLADVMDDASLKKNEWPPIKAGLFHGSSERFEEAAESFRNARKITSALCCV
jgi:hypothetical protein